MERPTPAQSWAPRAERYQKTSIANVMRNWAAGRSTESRSFCRMLALIGQVVIFCRSGKHPVLAGAGLDAESVRLMKAVVREHTEAICRAAAAAK